MNVVLYDRELKRKICLTAVATILHKDDCFAIIFDNERYPQERRKCRYDFVACTNDHVEGMHYE